MAIDCDSFIQSISETECVGDSLVKINDNFESLKNQVCTLFNQFPSGIVIEYAGASVPPGWLFCDGSRRNIVDYPDLYAVLGTRYGPIQTGTFKLPDLQGRVPVGAGASVDSGISPRVLADKGGVQDVTLSLLNLPTHNHAFTDPGHTHTGSSVASHSHNVTIPSHTHGITDPGHYHNVYAGYEAGSNDLTLASTYGEALATSHSAFFNHAHAWGAYSPLSGNAGTNFPGTYFLSDHSTGNHEGTQLITGGSGSSGSGYWVEQFGGATFDTQLQITIKQATTGITVNSTTIGLVATTAVSPALTITTVQTGISIQPAGSSTSHTNMQPFLVLNFIIKT